MMVQFLAQKMHGGKLMCLIIQKCLKKYKKASRSQYEGRSQAGEALTKKMATKVVM